MRFVNYSCHNLPMPRGNNYCIIICTFNSYIIIRCAAKKAAKPDNHIQLLDIVTYDDTKTHIKNKFQIKWQRHWLKQRTTLGEIKNTILNWQESQQKRKNSNQSSPNRPHKADTQVPRGQRGAQCTVCGVTLTVKNILIECHQ